MYMNVFRNIHMPRLFVCNMNMFWGGSDYDIDAWQQILYDCRNWASCYHIIYNYCVHCPMYVVQCSLCVEGQISCSLGTNRLPLLGDKQVVLIGGQTGCPYWGTNRLPLLGDKQIVLIGEQTGCPYWGTIRLPFLGDRQDLDHFHIISFVEAYQWEDSLLWIPCDEMHRFQH